MSGRNIGLFGGTFNPVHKAHIAVAEIALRKCSLDEIIFIPAASPPHKNNSIASFGHRQKMVQRAVAGYPAFSVSLIEEKLTSPNYTIDTITALSSVYPPKTYFTFIMGADAFLDIESWKEYEKLLGMVNLILLPRRGVFNEKICPLLQKLGYRQQNGHWILAGANRSVCFLSCVPPGLSSTEIRRRIAEGKLSGLSQLVDLQVLDYIKANGLYIRD